MKVSNSMHLMQRYGTAAQLDLPVAATRRAVEAGSKLTQHLLRVAGQQRHQRQRIDLRHWLHELAELLRSVLGRRVDVSAQVLEPFFTTKSVGKGSLCRWC